MRSKRDQELIQAWLECYNRRTHRAFKVTAWPDLDERQVESIDAVARDADGFSLGVEHTILQPFTGDMEDVPKFNRVLGRLHNRSDIAAPDWQDRLSMRVGAIPIGVSWEAVGVVVERWYVSSAPAFTPGVSVHQIADVGFELEIQVVRARVPGAGKVYAARQMPKESVHAVVRHALTAKLPKLVGANVDLRMLLLEQKIPARGTPEVGEAIEDLRAECPNLSAVNQVWCADTVAWENERFRSFHIAWPLAEGEEQDDVCAATEA